MADHLSPIFRPAFPSSAIISERSSPSRGRFAAPNNGAPLTAPGRSGKHFWEEGKAHSELLPRQGPLRRHFGTLFRRHRQAHLFTASSAENKQPNLRMITVRLYAASLTDRRRKS